MNMFSTNKSTRVRRNKFNLSHEKKMSLKMGNLTPILLQEVVPGDSFKVNSELMMRLSPMIAPVMHRMNAYTHYFFVPNRLVWNEWESFVTGGRQGDEAPVVPKLRMQDFDKSSFAKKTLADYFGLPVMDPAVTYSSIEEISALPFRAYQTIYNEYYQDQNLSDPIAFGLGSGYVTDPDERVRLSTMRKRAWEKDYFTSALPWTQRGGSASIPTRYKEQSEVFTSEGDIPSNIDPLVSRDQGAFGGLSSEVSNELLRIENIEGIDVNDLRKSLRLQEWLEKTARGGSRYIEQILSHFGVMSSDARLQRPEYLGGGRTPVVISEVLQTGATGTDQSIISTPQGNMAGHGISVGRTNSFKRRFEEHGHIIGILSVIPKTAYEQGIERLWNKFDKFDLYWPEFANLGEQAILNKEIYAQFDANQPANNQTFGYQSRYAEYKYQQSSVHGDFRDTLNFWHMGRKFDALPALNESFVESDPTKRIFAVEDQTEDELYCQVYNRVSAVRPMPYFGTPRT